MRTSDYIQQRVNMANSTSLPPGPGGIRGLGAISGPQFKDLSGNVITSIQCGQSYVFDVPGYSNVHLNMTKNGAADYQGTIAVPMPAYKSVCSTDPGVYIAQAFDLASGGSYLGSATFTILPAAAGTGAGSDFFSSLSPTEITVGVSVLLFLLARMRKGKK